MLKQPFLYSAVGALIVAGASGCTNRLQFVITLIACIVAVAATYQGFEELQSFRKDKWLILKTRRRRQRARPDGLSIVRTGLWLAGAFCMLLLGQRDYLYNIEGPKAAVESLVQWSNGAVLVERTVEPGSGIVWVRPGGDLDACPGFPLVSAFVTNESVRKICLLTRAKRPLPFFVEVIRLARKHPNYKQAIREVRKVMRGDQDRLLIVDASLASDPELVPLLVLLAAEAQLPFYIQTNAGGRTDTRSGCAVPFVMVGLKAVDFPRLPAPRKREMEWADYVEENINTAKTMGDHIFSEAAAWREKLRGQALNFPFHFADDRKTPGLPLEFANVQLV